MALASEDLWTKFGWSVDKQLTASTAADADLSATSCDTNSTGRSLLIVNNRLDRHHQRREAVVTTTTLSSPLLLQQDRVPDIRDLISCSSCGDITSSCGDLNSCSEGSSNSCLDDLADLNMDGGIDMEFDDVDADAAAFLLYHDLLDGLVDGDDTTDPLRHDCMWSVGVGMKATATVSPTVTGLPGGSCPSSSFLGDQLLLEQLGESVSCNPQLLLGSSPPSAAAPPSGGEELHCLVGTPQLALLRSETSDLEETSSDLDDEVMMMSDRRRTVVLPPRRPELSVRPTAVDPTHSDHSYIATAPPATINNSSYFVASSSGVRRVATASGGRATGYPWDILTPDESSSSNSSSDDDEDEEDGIYASWQARVSPPANNKGNNNDSATSTFRVPIRPDATATRRTGKPPLSRQQPPASGAKSTKFRFHIKFKPGKGLTASSGEGGTTTNMPSRSLLRSGPSRTCYTRRRRESESAAVRLIKDAFFPCSDSSRQQQQPLQVWWNLKV